MVADVIHRHLRTQEEPIDILISFDQYGVSAHPNHIACYHGIESVMIQKLFNFEFYALKTVGTFKKYMGYAACAFLYPMDYQLFLFSPWQNWRVLACHTSQFVWFRKLSVLFSRYTFVNSFDRFLQRPEEDENDASTDKSTSSRPKKATHLED